jgi:hypothetical protein
VTVAESPVNAGRLTQQAFHSFPFCASVRFADIRSPGRIRLRPVAAASEACTAREAIAGTTASGAESGRWRLSPIRRMSAYGTAAVGGGRPVRRGRPTRCHPPSLAFIGCACQSLATVLHEVENEESFEVSWPFQHLGVTQGASYVVVSRVPMLFHTCSREFVILRVPFVMPRIVDQMDDVEDLAIRGRAKEPGFRAVPQASGKLFQKGGCRAP